MSDKRQVWHTLANLIARLEQDIDRASANGRVPHPDPVLDALEKEVRKLGKAQFKANTLTETQLARVNALVADLQQAEAAETEAREAALAQRVAAAQQETLVAFLPVLDSLEIALSGGYRYLERRDRAADAPNLTPAQARLVSPADRAVLAGWLDGLRLSRDRLLALLAASGVTPIPTVGRPFDPYLHKAVGVTSQHDGPPGTIVAEERAGYQTENGVLRYAEVVVYRPSAVSDQI